MRLGKFKKICVGMILFTLLAAPADAVSEWQSAELARVMENTGRIGDSGRLIIPEADVDVALFYAHDNLENEAQRITDNQDSAVYMPWIDDQYMIADHWTQGFINIRNCREGTHAYILKEDRVEIYVCSELSTGHNMSRYFLINTDRPHTYKMNLLDVTTQNSAPVEIMSEGAENGAGTLYQEDQTENFRVTYLPDATGTAGGDSVLFPPEAEMETGETVVNEETEDPDYYITPHEWTAYYYPETEEGQSEFETETEIFWGQPLEYIADFDLFMYTCNGRWQDVYIGLFNLEDVVYL